MHYLAHSLKAFNVGLTWHPVRFQGGVGGGGGVGENKEGKEGGGLRSKTFTRCSNGGVFRKAVSRQTRLLPPYSSASPPGIAAPVLCLVSAIEIKV